MPTFDYASAIEELHGFLWRYVHENASVEESHDTVAELLDLAPLVATELLATHIITAPSTSELLARLRGCRSGPAEYGTEYGRTSLSVSWRDRSDGIAPCSGDSTIR